MGLALGPCHAGDPKSSTTGHGKFTVAESDRRGGKARYFLWIFPAIPPGTPIPVN